MLLKSISTGKHSSIESLLNLWAKRYTPDIFSLSLLEDPEAYYSLINANSAAGRALTVTKLTENVLDINSQMAWIQTKNLHEYIPNVLDLNEARRISQFATRVYKKILQVYQKQSRSVILPTVRPSDAAAFSTLHSNLSMRRATLARISYELEPILLVFQEQLLASKDWRALGFMTTQLKFTNKLILNYLTPIEKVLVGSYLKFVEEQVSIPWQRVCAAATKHQIDSPELTLVEQMMPFAEEVSQTVYHRLIQLFPHYYSLSGHLTDLNVAHSSLRDLTMFQAYLWLCVLEKSLAPIEQELINLCIMVLECIGVNWVLAEQSTQLLVDEILKRLMPEQKAILLPYTQGIQKTFSQVSRMKKCLL
jgi:hypothetical protein